ncbi:DUF4424 domain-containing protein [Rhodobacter sp. Har01]|uniref:DUF4424 family protein n=1 Tax=Rhodobacter sp. Har01 TaxID=2883999 RepID=UPI001D07A169|nr:DUF4424 family protein [Rhodobacter sp. Har01]MCB6179799.1 DUF4424 domain-containing protein [Rhodobacter sp. Har01]
MCLRLSLAILASTVALPAAANDGWGGLSATGLTFDQTEAVAMLEEDLFIGIDRVSVDYLFKNTSGADVTGEVIFPLSPVSVWATYESSMNLPQDLSAEDLVDFKVTVDGRPVAVQIDRIAVLEPPYDENRPPAQQYDTPGRDVTAEVARLGLPLTLDAEQVRSALLALSPNQKAAAEAAGLAQYYAGDPAQNVPPDVYATWSIVTRYHWTQTFPAGAEVKVHHDYVNRPPGGLFYWADPPEDYQTYLVDRYCIDAGTSKALMKALAYTDETGQTNAYGTSYNIEYVLRTANSWAGPIGKFRLTLDKGDPKNVISLCADGVKKVGPTTFMIEKTNYTPDRDLDILVALPMARE